MTHDAIVSNSPAGGQMHVYVLPVHDRTRLKIGRSASPMDRIIGLANIYPDIDFTRSVIIGVDTHRVETVLHTVFERRREVLDQRSDGYTEWFSGDFVDEVVDFCRLIAQHRGTEYVVYDNIGAFLEAYRALHADVGQRAPRLTNAERQAREPLIHARLTEAIVERAQRCIDFLAEREFEAIVHQGDRQYLVRSVGRDQEPECWLDDDGHRVSDWGRRLVERAAIDVRVDGGTCIFRLLQTPLFRPLDDKRGREYFRICEPCPKAPELGTDRPSPTDAAFAELWSALAHLGVIEAPCDPLDAHGPAQNDAN